MGKLGYLAKRLVRMDVKRLWRTIRHCSKASGKTFVGTALDMVRCAHLYLAAPADYALFEFYNLTPEQRATYVTRGINNQLVKKLNDKSLWHMFDNKDEFNTTFAPYIGREWIYLDPADFDAFSRFLKGKEVIFYKPRNSSCGWGIEKITLADEPDERTLFERLCAKGEGLCEEAIIQHPEMMRLFPGSVNTVRLVTVNDGKEVSIVFAFLRVGNGRVVDNLNSGGMAAPIDPEIGIVTHPAADKDYKAYDAHPATGTAFVGFQIPKFDEAKALVTEAAQVIPRMGYVGWDIAIGNDRLFLVEANSYPGHDILQLPPHVPDKIGLKGRIERFL